MNNKKKRYYLDKTIRGMELAQQKWLIKKLKIKRKEKEDEQKKNKK